MLETRWRVGWEATTAARPAVTMTPIANPEAGAPGDGGPRTPANIRAPNRKVMPDVTPVRIPVARLAQRLPITALAVTISGSGRSSDTEAPAASSEGGAISLIRWSLESAP